MKGWTEKEIRLLGRVVTGKTPPKEEMEYWTGEEQFVSPKDMEFDSWYIHKTQSSISAKALNKFKNQVLPRNSVMYTALSYGFGKIGLAKKRLLTNQQINSLIVNSSNDFRFVYYLLRISTPHIFSYNSGIDTPIVPKSVFEKIKLNVPSLPIQQKIAAVLSACDDLIENNTRRIAILEKMGEELYREWFVRLRFPGHEKVKIAKGVPEGWEVKRVGEILKFEKGKTPDALVDEKSEETDVYLNVEAIENGKCQFAPKIKSISCNENETLMLMDGARSSVVFNGQKGIVSSTFAVIRTDAKYRYMLHEYFKANLEAMVANNTGSAIPHANKEFIVRMCIKLPLKNLLVETFNNKYQDIFSQTQNLNNKRKLLTQSRDRLLSRLMSGKIDVEKMDIWFPANMQEEIATSA